MDSFENCIAWTYYNDILHVFLNSLQYIYGWSYILKDIIVYYILVRNYKELFDLDTCNVLKSF